ncbi:MAG: hypothetical protein ACRDL5_17130 [Solirubrobacteraceae bacterium]
MRRDQRPLRLEQRDLVLLSFMGEHRFVTAPQAAMLLRAGEASAKTRLDTLSAAALVQRSEPLNGWPSLYQVTTTGLRKAGSDLRKPSAIDLREHRHDHALVWLMLDALAGRFGPIRGVVGERRMRSEDRRAPADAPPHGVRRGGFDAQGRPRLHYPDLVVVSADGHRVAFELERSTKSRAGLEAILAAYAADRRVDAVVYLVERASTGRAVQRAAARLGISELISVRTIAPAAPAGNTAASIDQRSLAQRQLSATPEAGHGSARRRPRATQGRAL